MADNSVGSELLNEIERVSAKRARWEQYGNGHPDIERGCAPGRFLMTVAIDQAKAALAGEDAIKAIAALNYLRTFSDED